MKGGRLPGDFNVWFYSRFLVCVIGSQMNKHVFLFLGGGGGVNI